MLMLTLWTGIRGWFRHLIFVTNKIFTVIFTNKSICLDNCFPQDVIRHPEGKVYHTVAKHSPAHPRILSTALCCLHWAWAFPSVRAKLCEWGLQAALHPSLGIYEVLSTFFNPCPPKRDCSQCAPTPICNVCCWRQMSFDLERTKLLCNFHG